MIETVPGAIINIIGGLLVAGLGVLVLVIAPRRAVNRAFASYAIPFGSGIAFTNFWFDGRPLLNLLLSVLFVTFFVVAAGGTVWLAHVAGRRPDDAWWPTLVGGAVGMLSVAAICLVTLRDLGALDDAYYAAWNAPPPSTGFLSGYVFAAFVFFGATWAAVATLILRTLRLGPDESVRFRGLALLAPVIGFYPGFSAGVFLPVDDIRFLAYPLGALPVVALAAVAWLAMTRRPRDGKAARNAALFTLAAPLVGLLFSVVGLGNQGGTIRVITVAVLSYGILRHQLLDIDVKLRWGISRSTVAAVFIAVFFVVSEATQEFFDTALGGTYLGIAAAGALVFAIAPLQRVAERLAEKALPTTAFAPTGRPAHEEAYRAAVRLALRAGLTKEEERDLALIADAYGISVLRALQLRDEVERPEAALAGSGRDATPA